MANGTLILGRFTVFHVGHYSLIKNAKKKYPENELVLAVVYGEKSSKDVSKNPTSFEERERIITKTLNKNGMHPYILEAKTGYIPKMITDIKEKFDIDITVIYCGTDRLSTYQNQLDKAQMGNIKLEEVKRDLDTDLSEVESKEELTKKASATEVRKSVSNNDFENFSSLMPEGLDTDDMKDIWNIMRTAFKEKGLINHILVSGITHLEDLDIDEFIHFVENFYSENIVKIQKLDGTFNMSIVKENGKIQYKRLAKKQDEPFTADSLPENPIYNALRSACLACDFIQNTLDFLLSDGDAVDCEVLYSSQPNTVAYNLDKNYLAFLRMLQGDQSKIEKLRENLQGNTVSVRTPTYFYNWDTNSIEMKNQEDVWAFTTPQVINQVEGEQTDQLEILKQWLENQNDILPDKTNFDVMKLSLVGLNKDTKQQYKSARESALEEARKMKINIKQHLVENVLKKMNFDLGGTNQEGIVLRDDELKLITKLIDREGFTKTNKLNWKYIEMSTKGIKLDDGTWLTGVMAQLNENISNTFNVPMLKNPSQFVRYCKNQTDLNSNILAVSRFVESSIDTNNSNSKLLLINNSIRNAKLQIKELLDESKIDDNLSPRMKERTSDSLGMVFNKLNDLSSFIGDLVSKQDMTDNARITAFLIAFINVEDE